MLEPADSFFDCLEIVLKLIGTKSCYSCHIGKNSYLELVNSALQEDSAHARSIYIKEDEMIEVMPGSEGNKLILGARSKLTDQDYKDVLIPRLEAIIKEYGKARLLLDMGDDFQGWEANALWDDAHFGMTHRNDFEKMGVVGGPKWVDWGLKLATIIMSGEIKNFPASERDEALRWLDS